MDSSEITTMRLDISPVYKKLRERCDPQNYRPVCLTSVIYKTMEHILVSQIMNHLEMNSVATL